MYHLQRDARREGTMQAAIRLVLRGSFVAMTVRQIVREAEVAVGQLHHHFASIGELKSQVFIRLIREMLDMPLVVEDASWRGRLFPVIGSEDGRLESYTCLWREGQMLADSDPDTKMAHLLAMNMWHEKTVAIIEQGLTCGEFHSSEPPVNITWRFIALVYGLDGTYALGTQALGGAAFSRYSSKMITMELSQRTLPGCGRDPSRALIAGGGYRPRCAVSLPDGDYTLSGLQDASIFIR